MKTLLEEMQKYRNSIFEIDKPRRLKCSGCNRDKMKKQLSPIKGKDGLYCKICQIPYGKNKKVKESDEFKARTYIDKPGVRTHQTSLPSRIYNDVFKFSSAGPGRTEPNSVYTKYDNNGDKDLGESEHIITKYDRLTNNVEVIHTGQSHLPVYYDFNSPEKAQQYLTKFNIKLNIGKGYIK
jgi:hypothetical protein